VPALKLKSHAEGEKFLSMLLLTVTFVVISCRTTKKGYEEVHVPALKPKPYAEGEKLVAISDLPDWAQPAFGGMQSLNRVQSRVCDTALYSSENMLVCAPTGGPRSTS
jgi:pre-mRNA-splicing helicase BRR2